MAKQDKFTDFFRGFIEDIRKRLIDEGWFGRGIHADLRDRSQSAYAHRSFAEQLGLHPAIDRAEQAISRGPAPSQQQDHGIDL